MAYGLLWLCVFLQYARETHARDTFIGKHSCRFSYAESSVENKDQPFEIKTEADSNDINEHPHDDKSRPYLCTVCYKQFTCKHSLDRHSRIHSAVKRDVMYSCT